MEHLTFDINLQTVINMVKILEESRKKVMVLVSTILFDLDGTLVDSTSSVKRSWFKWAVGHQLNADEIVKMAHGRTTVETVKIIAPDLNSKSEAQAIENSQALDSEGVVVIPGAKELLADLPSNCWAIVTSGGRKIATERINYVGLPFPKVLVTSDDVTNGKPHPEGYLKAAKLLGAISSECLVVEDAPPGVEAAKAAGMRVISVTTNYMATQLSKAELIVANLTEIHIVVLENGSLVVSVV